MKKVAKGLNIKYRELYKIVGYLDDEFNESNVKNITQLNSNQSIETPVYGKASAGSGYINLETLIRKEKLPITPNENIQNNIFMVEVHGNSMYPTLIEGDLVVVDSACGELKDNGLYVINYNGETYIKRIISKKDYIQLQSDNPDRLSYPDIIIMRKEEIDFTSNGVVIEAKRKFKR